MSGFDPPSGVFRETVAALERESGLNVQTHEAEELQRALLAGDWDTCLNSLNHIQFVSEIAKSNVRRMILEEKYLELLEDQRLDAAMLCLQTELREMCKVSADMKCLLACGLT